jgi:tetratricopeptide (TPR) repeat protein
MTNRGIHSFCIIVYMALPMLCIPYAAADRTASNHVLKLDSSALAQAREFLGRPRESDDGYWPDLYDSNFAAYVSRDFSSGAAKDAGNDETSTMPLGTLDEVKHAEKYASELERSQQFKSAHKLYLRILQRRESEVPANSDMSWTLESVARTLILSKSWLPAKECAVLRGWQRPLQRTKGGWGPGEAFYSSAQVIGAIRNLDDGSEKQLAEAEQYYDRALSIHRQSKEPLWSKEQRILMCLGAVNERQHKDDEAKARYLEAFKYWNSPVRYLADFCEKKKDLAVAKQIEPHVLGQAGCTGDYGSISDLLDLYVHQGKFKDAMKLFKHTMTEKLFMRTGVLTFMLGEVPSRDTETIKEICDYVPVVWVRSPDARGDFEKVIQAMAQRGWVAGERKK